MPDGYGDLGEATGSQKKGPETEEESVSGREVWCPPVGTADNQQLLLDMSMRFLARSAFVPPGPSSLATVVNMWAKSTITSFIAAEIRAK